MQHVRPLPYPKESRRAGELSPPTLARTTPDIHASHLQGAVCGLSKPRTLRPASTSCCIENPSVYWSCVPTRHQRFCKFSKLPQRQGEIVCTGWSMSDPLDDFFAEQALRPKQQE